MCLVGPVMRQGDAIRAVRLGGTVSLLCGDQLRSRPDANAMWLDPTGVQVTGSAYTPIIDSTGVQLNLSDVEMKDNGTWTCNVTVVGTNVNDPTSNQVFPTLPIGAIENEIELIILGKIYLSFFKMLILNFIFKNVIYFTGKRN